MVQRLSSTVGDEVTSLKSRTRDSERLVTSSPTREFSNEDIYASERELQALHPGNQNIRPKIRQHQAELGTNYLPQRLGAS
jgi:hypothetical protein